MKVGLVTSLAQGGPVEHACVLARALVGRGHEVRVVCATGVLADRFAAVGADAIELPLRRGADLPGAGGLRAALKGVEVVHAHDRRGALWVRLLPRERRSVALVQTVHGLPDPFLPPPAGPGRPGARAIAAYRGLDAKLAWRCDVVVTPSETMRQMLEQRLGYPRARMTVVPNGVEVPPLPAGRPHGAVGTLSVLEPVKDIDTFLAAAAMLAERHADLAFTVNGAGSEDARLRRRARELGLGHRVAFPGHVPAAEALGRLRVLVISSVMENAPMSLVEAMARGVPVVATAVGGIPELAPDDTALLAAPGDAAGLATAVGRLLADPALARAQAERAHAHAAAHLSADGMALRMEDVYRRALGRRA